MMIVLFHVEQGFKVWFLIRILEVQMLMLPKFHVEHLKALLGW